MSGAAWEQGVVGRMSIRSVSEESGRVAAPESGAMTDNRPTVTEDQEETIAFLSDPDSYGAGIGPVERIETHCSIIFLVANRVFKLKRAVRFSSLDYSTIERRAEACKAELSLNRRTAPELYLDVRAIRRGDGGRLAFDGNGAIVDWVVVMRRFDQADLLDHRADARSLNPPLMRQLADEIAAFHAGVEVTPTFGGSTAVRAAIDGWRREWDSIAAGVDGAAGQAYHAAAYAALAEVADLLDRRREQGKVRRCHGDMRLANICLLEGRPTLFDCVEFNDEISCIDVLYDLAFPLMDLHHRGLAECANALFNRYVDVAGELEGLRALPLFLSLRAATRAQMLAAGALRHDPSETQHFRALARSHLALAQSALRRRPPRVIAIGGLTGSGKALLAQGLAADIAPAPGARIIRSDVIRKRLMNVSLEARLSPTAYDRAATQRVYDTIRRETATIVTAGGTVVVDATFLHAADRRSMTEVARAAGVPFSGLWLEMAGEALVARAGYRPGDRTTRDYAVLRQQLAEGPGAMDWHVIDASRGPVAALAAAHLLIAAAHG